MSQILIQQFLNELTTLKKVSGSLSETVIREAFKDLLKNWARQSGLIFVAELRMQSVQKTAIIPDGTVLHDLRVPLGYWEAKDTADDLEDEIRKKFLKGYPQDNIIFENAHTAILYQNRQEVWRADMQDVAQLGKLLTLFFGYERQEIADFRKAVAQFKHDLPAVLETLRNRIDDAYATNEPFQTAAAAFLAQSKATINPAVTEIDVREMLIQHILTEEIFAHVFNEGDFHRENNIAKSLYELEGHFFKGPVKRETLKAMEAYYAAIRANAAQITNHSEKQTFLKVIYENFYKVYNPKAADRLGVVYTPNEIVRFMIEGADFLTQKHFGRGLIDKDVQILDPATGTGTFICELIDYFKGQPDKLARKYKEELHANEVAILPYYVANLNIEATYAAASGQFAEYPSLCFVDTLDNVAALGLHSGYQHDLFGAISDENVARVKRQNQKTISVVIGNPPYNAWQESFSNRNPNRAYKRIDERIKDTYVKQGTSQNQNSVYDMYTRFIRWASDRVDKDGIITFITGRKPFAKDSYNGFRKAVAKEFSEIWVVDLGGDVRDNPKLSGTKHNVFGIQTGVSIFFMVKRAKSKDCKIFYARRPEMDTAEDKLAWLASQRLSGLTMERIEPDKKGNWLNLTDNDWDSLIPLADKITKTAKAKGQEKAIFKLFSSGLKTQRDDWVWDFDKNTLEAKMLLMVAGYESVRKGTDGFDKDSLKWDRELEKYLRSGVIKSYDPKAIRLAAYRPYTSMWLYFDKHFNGMTYQLPSTFPPGIANPTIAFLGMASSNLLSVLGVKEVFDLCLLKQGNGGTQGVPRYRYTAEGQPIDNITDWGLKQFEARYGKGKVTKDDIFAYCYGVLHDPVYRDTYTQNLKRDFPRVPLYDDFTQWCDWGQTLLELHIGYESVEPFGLTRTDTPDLKAHGAGLKPAPKLKSDPAAGTITLDSETALTGVPPEAYNYRLGNRSAIDWVLDQYKEKTPKDKTIREKFNTYRFADYKEQVIDLLQRVTTVSMKTVAITQAMKALKR
ncbi:type ISP restriction/modification enzyme [Asticcacaulis endophyticus]|uniref:site-specific DNA-methyltransferase (adenine-specific) n=1 Tax=Asticcacaulis endophyticus TaxID=1395890 RepID=A0A918Q4M3_9CAUL|nr:type ISP restriction/modification enzyme [Asticcacaulis endophyticus]GGZ30645.1 hypothetical protein GCM10011273_16330 [Asticcacaulis endophyticus]